MLPHQLARSQLGRLAGVAALIGHLLVTGTAAFTHDFSRKLSTNSKVKLDAAISKRQLPGTFLRWRVTNDITGHVWEMQTAVATFQNAHRKVLLHSMIHYGTVEYFNYYNDIRTTVLFELLIDEDMLNQDGNFSRLKPGALIQATPKDQSVAAQYGLTCQADAIRYGDSNWIHADYSTQEFLNQVPSKQNQQYSRPLWQIAANEQFPAPAMEAATALMVGPPFLSIKYAKRRLFSNLFVPGSTVANILRACLWFTVPAPELSILILDWSSLTSMSASQITWPLAQAIAKGQFTAVRQLLFGQVALLASKANSQFSGNSDLLISQRNQRAMDVLGQLDPSISTVSLLYGCNHCPDLQRRLEEQGYQLTATEWRTAWSVRLDKMTESNADGSPFSFLFLLVPPLYLVISAFDWISTWEGVIQSDDLLDFLVLTSLYLLRHVISYSALSKYVLDWHEEGTDDDKAKTFT